MTSPSRGTTPADDGAPSDDEVLLASGETNGQTEETPSSTSFHMLGLAGGDACGPDGCEAPTSKAWS